MSNLISLYTQNINSQKHVEKPVPVKSTPAKSFIDKSNLLQQNLNQLAVLNKPINLASPQKTEYKNDLRTLFQNNEAKILVILPRTFNAKDVNGNEYIDTPEEESGTFLNAIKRLDEVKSEGFNTLHILPINPTGKKEAMGTAGSVYAPLDLLQIDPVLDDKNDPRTVKEEFKEFINECHKRNIRVMVDLPSCASLDLYEKEPSLMAKELNGNAKTPQGWNDIRMFQPWEDKSKRTLNKELLNLHKDFVDMCLDLGVDGIRADVARAKPVEFWDILIPYSRSKNPEFAWLGETYTYEDASPQVNMTYDRPEDTLRAGFDSYYGQYHIFHEWQGAKDLMNHVRENLEMSSKLDKGKSTIGSFVTHDDKTPMFSGGEIFCNLISGLSATLPMTNPYFVDGFQYGDNYVYPYAEKTIEKTATDNHTMTVHQGQIDIFNLSRKPQGNFPQIGKFMTSAFKMRDKFKDIITKGSFIELEKSKDKNDQVIAFARHLNGKTLLILANKNVNHPSEAIINVPSLKTSQNLENLLPNYGENSLLQVEDNKIKASLGAGRIHVFEIDTPDIEKYCKKENVLKQK